MQVLVCPESCLIWDILKLNGPKDWLLELTSTRHKKTLSMSCFPVCPAHGCSQYAGLNPPDQQLHQLHKVKWEAKSLAQMKIGLKIAIDYKGAWGILMVPDRILGTIWSSRTSKMMLVITRGPILNVWSRLDMIWLITPELGLGGHWGFRRHGWWGHLWNHKSCW